MKILHVIPTYLPAVRYGGPMFSVHALCRNLARLGHEVSVCTTNIDGKTDLKMPLGVPVDLEGVSVRYFEADRLRRLGVSTQMRSWIALHIREFDLVHTHSVFLWPPWYAARTARLRGTPYVMAPRGMLVPEMIAQRNRFAKTVWLRCLEWRNLARADALHFTSELEREDAQRLGIPVRRAEVIANGVDLQEVAEAGKHPLQAKADSFVLFLGRISWKKGLDLLLQAMVLAPSVYLVLAGNDDEGYREILERIARELGVADRVCFRGPVYGVEKWRLLRSARALVLLSRSENFGNTVLEAMAVGKPVVISPNVGLVTAVRAADCGVAVSAEAGAVASALERLWNDKTLCDGLGERGRALVERDYGWPRIAAQMTELYKSIVEVSATERTRN